MLDVEGEKRAAARGAVARQATLGRPEHVHVHRVENVVGVEGACGHAHERAQVGEPAVGGHEHSCAADDPGLLREIGVRNPGLRGLRDEADARQLGVLVLVHAAPTEEDDGTVPGEPLEQRPQRGAVLRGVREARAEVGLHGDVLPVHQAAGEPRGWGDRLEVDLPHHHRRGSPSHPHGSIAAIHGRGVQKPRVARALALAHTRGGGTVEWRQRHLLLPAADTDAVHPLLLKLLFGEPIEEIDVAR